MTRSLRWAVVCCQGVALLACAAPPAERRPTTAPAPHELVVEGVQAERWIDGELRLSARAGRATLDRRAGRVAATDVQILARDAIGAEAGRVDARALSADVRGERAELSGDVVLRDPSGRTASATSATYLGSTSELWAPGAVRVEGSNFVAEGRSMRFSLASQTATVGGPIGARVQAR